MAFAFGHVFSGAVQALFGLDHRARGETVFAPSVMAQLHEFGRAPHHAHHGVELLDAVAVPVREHRHVAPREGGLLVRDGAQRDGGIGDDPRAVVARDLAVHFRAVAASIPSPAMRCTGAPI